MNYAHFSTSFSNSSLDRLPTCTQCVPIFCIVLFFITLRANHVFLLCGWIIIGIKYFCASCPHDDFRLMFFKWRCLAVQVKIFPCWWKFEKVLGSDVRKKIETHSTLEEIGLQMILLHGFWFRRKLKKSNVSILTEEQSFGRSWCRSMYLGR